MDDNIIPYDSDDPAERAEELAGAVLDLEARLSDLNKKLEDVTLAQPQPAFEAPDFEQTVSHIRKRDNCSRQDALTKARHENAAGFESYMADSSHEDFDTAVEAELAKGACSEAIAKQRVGIFHPHLVSITKQEKTPFERVVDAIMEQDGCSRSVAMSRARKKEPTKFQHYQEA